MSNRSFLTRRQRVRIPVLGSKCEGGDRSETIAMKHSPHKSSSRRISWRSPGELANRGLDIGDRGEVLRAPGAPLDGEKLFELDHAHSAAIEVDKDGSVEKILVASAAVYRSQTVEIAESRSGKQMPWANEVRCVRSNPTRVTSRNRIEFRQDSNQPLHILVGPTVHQIEIGCHKRNALDDPREHPNHNRLHTGIG